MREDERPHFGGSLLEFTRIRLSDRTPKTEESYLRINGGLLFQYERNPMQEYLLDKRHKRHRREELR